MTIKRTYETYENEPWVSNYPPLKEWLERHEARCQWQLPVGPKKTDAIVSAYIVRKSVVLVTVRSDQMGWSIHTELNSNLVRDVLADADVRTGDYANVASRAAESAASLDTDLEKDWSVHDLAAELSARGREVSEDLDKGATDSARASAMGLAARALHLVVKIDAERKRA